MKDCIPDDFSPEFKKRILDRALAQEQSGKIYGPLIRLIGLAEIREALPLLERLEKREWEQMGHDPLVPEPGEARGTYFLRNSITWDCLLVRARWGDKAAMDRAIEVINSLPDEPDRVRQAAGLIRCTARREAIDYALPFFYSDELTGSGDGIDVRYPSYAQTISPQLSLLIPDFPAWGGLEACRKWMKEHEKDYQITIRTQYMSEVRHREEYEKRQAASPDQCDKRDETP